MIQAIETAMYDDNHSIYTNFRNKYAAKIEELEKERGKILRRKKNKKEKMKMLYENSYNRLYFIANAVNDTVKHFKKLYYEFDYYRQKKLMEIEDNKSTPVEVKDKAKLD
jgi:hypothetical protein